MSTNYYVGCTATKTYVDFGTRQAWGVGNADILDGWCFVMEMALEHGPESIVFFSEYDRTADEWLHVWAWSDGKGRDEWLKFWANNHYMRTFPRTEEWSLHIGEIPAVIDEYVTNELKRADVKDHKRLWEEAKSLAAE